VKFDSPTATQLVLTVDDGPLPTTFSVLKALADECPNGLFFPVAKENLLDHAYIPVVPLRPLRLLMASQSARQ
jgi:hypothetical protein